MAEVYVAKTKGIGGFEKQVAVKVIHPRYSEDEHFVQMLVEEAKISVLLTHVNIAQTFDLGKQDDQYYIVMEYIEGADAYRVMRKCAEQKRAMPIDVVTFAVAEMCNGLDYAHRKRAPDGSPLNIVHRDISPQNVLISFSGEVKLVDFGIAKAASRSEQTEAGVIKGKYYYMSPEQAWGDPMDHRSDIFSTGVVLYELLTGRMLYTDDNVVVLLDKVRKADIAPPSKRRPSIPKELSDIVMKALAKSPDDRYQSAQELAQALSTFLYNASPAFSTARLGELMGQLFPDQAQRHSNQGIIAPAREPTPTPQPAPKAGADMSGWGDDEDDATRHDVLPFRRLSAAADDAARRSTKAQLENVAPAKNPLVARPLPADLLNRPAAKPEVDDDWEEATLLGKRPALGKPAAQLPSDDFDDSTMIESGEALRQARAALGAKVIESGRGRVHVNAPSKAAPSVPPPPKAGAWGRGAPLAPPSRPLPPPNRVVPPPVARPQVAPPPAAPDVPPAAPAEQTAFVAPAPVPTVPLAAPAAAQVNTALVPMAEARNADPTGPFDAPRPYTPPSLPTSPFAAPHLGGSSPGTAPAPGPWPQHPPPQDPAWLAPPPHADPFAPPPAMTTQSHPGQEELGRPRPLRILAGLSILVVLAIFSALAVTWLTPDAPPPALAIVTNPPGATVLLDGSPLPGVTPLLVSAGLVEGQSYTLGVRLDGYSPWDATIVVRPGTTTQEISLVSAPSRLHVDTIPAGAAVSINGAALGVSPLDAASLFVGQQVVVRATLPGYLPAQTTVRLAGPDETVTLTLAAP